jgi:hypothetical protein
VATISASVDKEQFERETVYVIGAYKAIFRTYDYVNFNAHPEALEDYLAINLNAAWRKANAYYTKLNASPAYYSATCLYLYYRNYCLNS